MGIEKQTNVKICKRTVTLTHMPVMHVLEVVGPLSGALTIQRGCMTPQSHTYPSLGACRRACCGCRCRATPATAQTSSPTQVQSTSNRWLPHIHQYACVRTVSSSPFCSGFSCQLWPRVYGKGKDFLCLGCARAPFVAVRFQSQISPCKIVPHRTSRVSRHKLVCM